MKQAQELYNFLKQISVNDADVFPAIVDGVNGDGTVNVLYDEYGIDNCIIQANDKNIKGIQIKPKVGSTVLVQKVGDTNPLFFIILFSEIDEYSNEIDNMIYKL